MMKRVAVYRRRGSYLMAADCHTKDGFWLTVAPYRKLPGDVNAGELGSAVREMLPFSRSGIPTPSWKDDSDMQELLDAAGVKSYSTFMKGALLVKVRVEDEWATMIPMLNRGGREGFEHLNPSSGPHARVDDPEELGRKLLDAFELAE